MSHQPPASQRVQLFKSSCIQEKQDSHLELSSPVSSERSLSMRTLLALAVIMVFGLMWVQGDLLRFNRMISLVTKKNGITKYGAYGCHCGLGGKGAPKDATDRQPELL
ncbi:phospholipase A2, membrane associated-like [Ictidomys tridecemlineatus]